MQRLHPPGHKGSCWTTPGYMGSCRVRFIFTIIIPLWACSKPHTHSYQSTVGVSQITPNLITTLWTHPKPHTLIQTTVGVSQTMRCIHCIGHIYIITCLTSFTSLWACPKPHILFSSLWAWPKPHILITSLWACPKPHAIFTPL